MWGRVDFLVVPFRFLLFYLQNSDYFEIISNSDWGRLQSELALFESATIWYLFQTRSAPAVNRTRHEGSIDTISNVQNFANMQTFVSLYKARGGGIDKA